MISVASFLMGKPADFKSVNQPEPVNEKADCNSDKNSQDCTREDRLSDTYRQYGFNRESYYANYELFSTITPPEYDRPAMRFPFDDEDD